MIDRASANDVLQMDTDVGPVPMQVGAVLVLDGEPLAIDEVREAIEARSRAVPRLRQRLVRTPLLCGRPVWVSDERFDVTRHVHRRPCPPPGDETALLEVAAELVTTRLPADRPLWSATLVTGVAGRAGALVVVFHHVLADGIGGLAVLANLVDGVEPAGDPPFQPRPGPVATFVDATRARLGALRHPGRALTLLRDARRELGRGAKPQRCSLNAATGSRRAFSVARVDLAPVVELAHREGATVNDVVLTAVAGALRATLADRGERPPPSFVVSVPVSTRRSASAEDLGNEVGVMPVEVPSTRDPLERLAATAGTRRDHQGGSAGASAALVAPLFRLLARLGLFRRFIERQRLVHTFVTNLRGPEEQFAFLGRELTAVVPMTSVAGNVTVAFAVLSYAGTLGVTVVADPETCPDHDRIRHHLQAELDDLAEAIGPEPLRAPASP